MKVADSLGRLRRVVVVWAMALLAAALGLHGSGGAAEEMPRHGIAMHGMPALAADFPHFPYADPAARKGGRIVVGMLGSYDSLNPYIVRGSAPQQLNGLVYQSLLARSADEAFSLYPQLAVAIDVPADRTSITFHLDRRAKFADGSPLTARDVLFSFDLLKRKGRPNFRGFYGKVETAEALDETTVRFAFPKAGDRELPLILGLMPIFSATTDAETFDQTTLKPPLGTGPYTIGEVKIGASLILKRNPAYWGADIPSSRGLYNPDEIRLEFFRDSNTLFEAFKTGLVDLRFETDPTVWRTGYDFPAVRQGRVTLERIPVTSPRGMSGFVMNTRRPALADARVREALGQVFDFEWINRNLFFDAYQRLDSYFAGSDLASTGVPASAAERQFLAGFPGAVRPDVLEGTWRPPVSDGSGRDRDQARRALDLLTAAGWTRKGEQIVSAREEPLAFEIIVSTRQQERLALMYAASLARIGVKGNVRIVDDSLYAKRLFAFDFDMAFFTWGATASPGNEQTGRWGSQAAERQNTLNFAGVRSPAIDAAIEKLLAAVGREDYLDAVRLLDRLLLSGFYVVPGYYLKDQLVARSAGIARPARAARNGLLIETLWRTQP